VVGGCRLRQCLVCQAVYCVKIIWCVCWIAIQKLTRVCWSRQNFSWWKGHFVFIVRWNGGNSAVIRRQRNFGCSALCAPLDCFNKELIHLVILWRRDRYNHVYNACFLLFWAADWVSGLRICLLHCFASTLFTLQCFGAVTWATGRAFSL